jgi:glutaredoxin-like protein
MSQLLNESILDQVRQAFADLQSPVEILFFGQGKACDYCEDTHQLIEEIVTVSSKLSMSGYDLQKDADVAEKYKIDKAPGLIIAAKEGQQITDYGIRYAGIPSGHEFSSLIQDILLVSKRDSGLTPQTREFLKGLSEPLRLQVFVTPTCPYCPRAVVLAHMLAIESPMVQAEMVEATEFPELSNQFGVSGVPHTVINSGKGNVIGAVPEGNLLAEIQRALGR